jgi:hypothetical protein
MNLDPSKLPLLLDFRVERRVGAPYDQNVYYSGAPLRTADHVAVLEEFERAMQVG